MSLSTKHTSALLLWLCRGCLHSGVFVHVPADASSAQTSLLPCSFSLQSSVQSSTTISTTLQSKSGVAKDEIQLFDIHPVSEISQHLVCKLWLGFYSCQEHSPSIKLFSLHSEHSQHGAELQGSALPWLGIKASDINILLLEKWISQTDNAYLKNAPRAVQMFISWQHSAVLPTQRSTMLTTSWPFTDAACVG